MTNNKVGVRPHQKPWPKGNQYDQELLGLGDKRNVIDKYRYLTVEAIKDDLDKTRLPLHIAVENWQNDFNIGSIIRTANAFNLETVHIIGKKHWNRRGAMVTDRYMNIIHHDDINSFIEFNKEQKRQIIVFDNIEGSVELSKTKLPKKAVLVFGGEGPGVSQDMRIAAKKIVKIEQFGSTRSVNVGVAAGIAMYSWLKQYILNK